MGNVRCGNDITINAILALKDGVNKASLSDGEKNALLALLDKMLIYYESKKTLILNKGGDFCDERLTSLYCFMTDIIVKINNALTGETDVHYFVSLMQNELQEKDLKKMFISK